MGFHERDARGDSVGVRRWMRAWWAYALAALGVVLAVPIRSAASAAPHAEARDGARITRVAMVTPTRATVTVFSPAMRKSISETVLLPADRTRPVPTLYLLDGIDAGVYTRYTESGWTTQTDVVRFMADKPVNVVLPIGGTASYYTDWNATDPVLGRNKWETFLTTELPPLIVTYHFRAGLHSWGYWNQDLHRAWPTLARPLGVR